VIAYSVITQFAKHDIGALFGLAGTVLLFAGNTSAHFEAGQIAGLIGAYGSVGSVAFMTILLLTNPLTFFLSMGVTGAVGLSITSTYGWGFAVGLMGLASAWLVTTSMAYYTIRKGLVALHKEWMIRAYVVTFAFVTFRILSDYGPTSRLQPENDRSLTITWVCWVVPLGITEIIFQLKRVRAAMGARG